MAAGPKHGDEKYDPISCAFHETLLERATFGVPTDVVYRDAQGREVRKRDRIDDVFTRSGAEYLRLSGGEEIRLDMIVSVDGEPALE